MNERSRIRLPVVLDRSAAASALLALGLLGPVADSARADWFAVPSGTSQNLQDVDFPTGPLVGYAVGNNGTILKTTDGGDTWVAQTSGVTSTLRGLDFPVDDVTGWVVGSGPTILKTTDGGASWVPQNPSDPFALRDVDFPVDTLSGWAVGHNASIMNTTDGGATWFNQPPLTIERINSVQFPIDTVTGFAAVNQGNIIKTTDSGNTWRFQVTTVTVHLHDLHFPVGALNGWAVGDGGTILRTTTGTNFSQLTSGTTDDLRGVHFPDANTGYAVGANGTIVKTTDSGNSWNPEASGTGVLLRRVSFPTATIGFAVGDAGTILRHVPPGTPTISSAADQAFLVGDFATNAEDITITEDAASPAITATNDLRLRVPAGFAMIWDPSVSFVGLSGPAAGKVSSTPSYEDGNRTVVLDVTADFAAGESVTVSLLRFANFFGESSADNLELEVRNDGLLTSLDDRTIRILAPRTNRSSSIDLARDGIELWVVNPDHNSVSVFETQGPQTGILQAEIPVGRDPWSVDLHPANGEAWVTSQGDDHVYVIDVASRTVVDSIAVGYEPFGVAFNPSGSTALVTSTGSAEILAIDVPTRAITQTLVAHQRPRGIVWKADGSRAFVTHLLMPEFFGRLTEVFPTTWTTVEIFVKQVFGTDRAGYPSTMQNATLGPDGTHLWIPNTMLNTTTGGLTGNPLTPQNITHACIRPVNISTQADLNLDTYFLSDGGSPNTGFPGGTTPVGGPIAVDFKSGHAYVANLHSDNVTVLTDNILGPPTEVTVLAAGRAPVGVMAHPDIDRVYIHNWLSRDVSVIDTITRTVVATWSTTTSEPLPPQVLNGKQLFFTSTGAMSFDGRGACASCHVFGRHDGRPWDLSQFGKHVRATPDVRGIGFTGAHDFTADKDEMADHNFGIIEFMGGPGLIPSPNPPLGAPNAGLSQDMDDIGRWMATLTHRSDTPFLLPDGNLSPDAQAGKVLFEDGLVGCASCHSGPFFTDSRLDTPFVKHDVGTLVAGDLDGGAGFDTPSLVGAWDRAPYLHHRLAQTLQAVMTTFNPDDLHGTTSHLTAPEIDQIAAYVSSLGWPDSTGTAVDAPVLETHAASSTLERAFPNPFHENTSIRFSVEASPSNVTIEIFDVAGRRVRALLDRSMTRGTHVVGWDSRSDSGTLASPGVYWARLVVNGEPRGEKKLTVVR